MFKDFLMKQMLKRQLKGLPEAEQERIMKAISEHPDFFKKIGEEIKEKQKAGMDQMMATMSVLQKYKADLQRIMNQ